MNSDHPPEETRDGENQMKQKPLLTVIEGKWLEGKDLSVKDVFGPLFTLWGGNGGIGYDYEMFTNEAAFKDAARYAMRPGSAHLIYVGSHGNSKRIHGFHGQGVSRKAISSALDRRTTVKHGIYFGSCEFGHKGNAAFIFKRCPGIQWMAGYDKPVDWIHSSVLDLLFLEHFLFSRGAPLQRFRYAAAVVGHNMGQLREELGFHVYERTPHTGAPRDLFEPQE